MPGSAPRARNSLLPPRQRLDQAGHLLATLAGRTPAELTLQDVDLAELKLPADLPLSLPSELARQRPDVLEAESQLHAASANIGREACRTSSASG